MLFRKDCQQGKFVFIVGYLPTYILYFFIENLFNFVVVMSILNLMKINLVKDELFNA